MKIKHQQGASVLEMLIIIPLFLLFIILVSEVGVMFYTLNALTKTTQDAARYMSENKSEFATRQVIANNLLIYGSAVNTGTPLLPGTININASTFTIVDSGTHVSVVTTYTHNLFMGSTLSKLSGLTTGGSLGFGDNFTLSASSVMRFAQ